MKQSNEDDWMELAWSDIPIEKHIQVEKTKEQTSDDLNINSEEFVIGEH